MRMWEAIFRIVESFNARSPGYGLAALALLLLMLVALAALAGLGTGKIGSLWIDATPRIEAPRP